jgi:hypothetical protein
MSSFQPTSKRGSRAMRLTFAYEGEEIRLVERQSIEKRVRASDPILEKGEAGRYSGFWIELRDAEGQTLYRRVLHDPIQTSVEVPSDDPNQSFSRHTVENPRGTFFVILPDLDRADRLVVFSSPPDPEFKGRAGAREIARLDLKQDYRQDRDRGKGQ